jgi:CRP-like cAMP-binding protein
LKKERRFCRGDFERVVLGAAMARRTAYDSFLATMPLLQPLDQAERGAIADSLVPRTLAEGEVCVDEGEVTTAIFFVQSGELEARQPSICTTAGASQGQATPSAAAEAGSFGGLELTLDEPSAAAAAAAAAAGGGGGGEAGAASYRTGDYFGAVSLLTDAPQPRAIAAASAGGAAVLSLERRAFKRLVGAKTKSSAELRQVRVPSGNENTLSFFLSNSFTLSFLRKR